MFKSVFSVVLGSIQGSTRFEASLVPHTDVSPNSCSVGTEGSPNSWQFSKVHLLVWAVTSFYAQVPRAMPKFRWHYPVKVCQQAHQMMRRWLLQRATRTELCENPERWKEQQRATESHLVFAMKAAAEMSRYHVHPSGPVRRLYRGEDLQA